MWFSVNFIERCVTLKEEVKFWLIQSAITILDHSAHLEGEHELMLLENTHTGEIVDHRRNFVHNEAETCLQDIVLFGSRKRIHEDSHV